MIAAILVAVASALVAGAPAHTMPAHTIDGVYTAVYSAFNPDV
jgi:hypothetical protein